DIRADAIVDECEMGAHVWPEEPISARADLGTKIQAEIILIGLLLNAQTGLGVPKLVGLRVQGHELDSSRTCNEVAEMWNRKAGTQSAAKGWSAEVFGILAGGVHVDAMDAHVDLGSCGAR